MIPSLSMKDLGTYTAKQIGNFFPDRNVDACHLDVYIGKAMERTEYCFSRIGGKYFSDGEQTLFNHLNTDQYAMFLYFLSNTLWRLEGDVDLAAKVYCLNKTLHALDVFYEVELPDIFRFLHPVGTVLGRGQYSNYFVAYQRCTIGTNLSYEHPTLGEGVVMYAGSAVIGNSEIGENCWVSIGTTIMDKDIPSNQVVFGRPGDIAYKDTSRDVIAEYFREVPAKGGVADG